MIDHDNLFHYAPQSMAKSVITITDAQSVKSYLAYLHSNNYSESNELSPQYFVIYPLLITTERIRHGIDL